MGLTNVNFLTRNKLKIVKAPLSEMEIVIKGVCYIFVSM